MQKINRFLLGTWGPLLAGTIIGILAALLVKLGNPGNMGICVACFTRDIAGALGLHRAGVVQYLRPEIPGFILGAFLSSFLSGEFKPRSGSSPLLRFFLGFFAMVGALVFLGCPWRAYLRLSGGDWNALYGLAGLITGVLLGIAFLWKGFSLGRSTPNKTWGGLAFPLVGLALLALLFLAPQFGRDASGNPGGPIFFSSKGPGAMHAPLLLSLGVGLLVGWLGQKTRFCTVGALRDLVMLRDGHLFWGVLAFTVSAFCVNYLLGQFHPGFTEQPVAHGNALWNYMGMVLSGLAFTLAGGCPGRQCIMSGEGDGDAAIFILGMLMGAAFCHNFMFASSPAGPGPFGPATTLGGLVFCLLIGLCMREKIA